MPSVSLEASVWTQLGLLFEVEGPLVSEAPVERAACRAEGLLAALPIHKEWTHFIHLFLCVCGGGGLTMLCQKIIIIITLSSSVLF